MVTRVGRRHRWWQAFAALVATLSCAVSVPPSGGPQDKTPPRVVQTVPALDSTGVSTDAEIQLTFSEPVQRTALIRQLHFEPPIEIGTVRWSNRSVAVTAYHGLRTDTTYVVTLKPGYRDTHNVPARDIFRFAFATSARIDTGSISGSVVFAHKPTDETRVQCFILPLDSGHAPGSAPPNRQAKPRKDGTWSLDYLPADSVHYLVWAYAERNRNDQFDPGTDIAIEKPDTILLTPGSPRRVIGTLEIIDPHEPGSVTGTVINTSGIDTIAVSVALYAPADSGAVTYLTRCTPAGAYRFKKVAPGRYALAGFVDVRTDSLCGSWVCGPDSTLCPEPCVTAPDSVTVSPGKTVAVPSLTLVPAGERPR